jgi:hypothetical protein
MRCKEPLSWQESHFLRIPTPAQQTPLSGFVRKCSLNVLDCRKVVAALSVLTRLQCFDQDGFNCWDDLHSEIGIRHAAQVARVGNWKEPECHRALQNQPPMGASKPASLGGGLTLYDTGFRAGLKSRLALHAPFPDVNPSFLPEQRRGLRHRHVMPRHNRQPSPSASDPEPGGALAGFEPEPLRFEPGGALAGFDSGSGPSEPGGALAGFDPASTCLPLAAG